MEMQTKEKEKENCISGSLVSDTADNKIKTAAKQRKRHKTSLAEDVLWLLFKIIFLVTLTVLLFTFFFGILRNTDNSMEPAVKDGDLVFYYRLDKDYSASDILIYSYKGKTVTGRVIATAGDTVDIHDGSLYVNGSLQQERSIYFETNRYEEGVGFPLTVGAGQVFILGDNREKATDSRIFGCVNISDTSGKVMGFLRRRNL